MKSLMFVLISIIFAVVFSFQQSAEAQVAMPNSVLANGGARLSNGTNEIVSTVGQAIIGEMSNSFNIMRVGFWYVISRVPNTAVGSNVVSQPVDPQSGTAPVTLTFSNVTQAGSTNLTTTSTGPPPPTGFKLGSPPTYYNRPPQQFFPARWKCVSTTAESLSQTNPS